MEKNKFKMDVFIGTQCRWHRTRDTFEGVIYPIPNFGIMEATKKTGMRTVEKFTPKHGYIHWNFVSRWYRTRGTPGGIPILKFGVKRAQRRLEWYRWKVYIRKHGYSRLNFVSMWHRTRDTSGRGGYTHGVIYNFTSPLQHTYVKILLQHKGKQAKMLTVSRERDVRCLLTDEVQSRSVYVSVLKI